MKWVVTGGAGYIGAHVAIALLQSGAQVTVLDDLSTGDPDRIPAAAQFVRGSILDPDAARAALHGAVGVVHVAGKKQVGESTVDPLYYWDQNVNGMRNLLQTCFETNVARFVFSSSAAVYGDLNVEELYVGDNPRPVSPYGNTKYASELMLADYCAAHGMTGVSLRYFNVAGAERPTLGDPGVFNLIPIIFRALDNGSVIQVYGSDYPTPDGTCVRDYIHVSDLADAHVSAVNRILTFKAGSHSVFNVATGVGHSVLEVIQTVEEVTGKSVPWEFKPRRAGDPAVLVAATGGTHDTLRWRSQRTLTDSVESAWAAWQHQPR